MLLGTDVPDELCEVAEICGGTSLISSAIISCGVHHLRKPRRKIKLLLFLRVAVHADTRTEKFFRQEEMKKRPGSPEETLRITDAAVLEEHLAYSPTSL